MSTLGKTLLAITALSEAGVKKNAKQLAAQVQTLASAATAVQEGPLKEWILELLRKWPDTKAILSEPDVFENDARELLVELFNHGPIDDDDMPGEVPQPTKVSAAARKLTVGKSRARGQ